jgi:hypothetical protein
MFRRSRSTSAVGSAAWCAVVALTVAACTGNSREGDDAATVPATQVQPREVAEEICGADGRQLMRLFVGASVDARVEDSTCWITWKRATYRVDVEPAQITVVWSDPFVTNERLDSMGLYLTDRYFATPASAERQSRRVTQLQARPDPAHRVRCGMYLSSGSGSVMITAVPGRDAVPIWNPDRFSEHTTAGVVFGDGLGDEICTDTPAESEPARDDERWPISIDKAAWDGPTDTCAAVTLRLVNAEAIAPDGTEIPLGKVTVANDRFGFSPPFDCSLDS